MTFLLYKFLRLEREGYSRLTENMLTTTNNIRSSLVKMQECADGARANNCLPVVAAMLNPELELSFDCIDLHLLFKDTSEQTSMFRIVVKASLTRALAGDLVLSIERTVDFLLTVGEGYKQMHSAAKTGKRHPSTNGASGPCSTARSRLWHLPPSPPGSSNGSTDGAWAGLDLLTGPCYFAVCTDSNALYAWLRRGADGNAESEFL
ncbi:hypothetical protein T492DRAFT_886873 [Pavlovales sp. CCMP2436]|nr:hypothetical protein T492DRAFT_886873 [Pavlovales sp. CCMP2436]